MECQPFIPDQKPYMGRLLVSATLRPRSRVRTSDQPSLGLDTAVSVYERQQRWMRGEEVDGMQLEMGTELGNTIQAREMGNDNVGAH